MTTPPQDIATAIAGFDEYIHNPPTIARADYVNADDSPARQAAGARAYERIRKRLTRQLERARLELAEFSRQPYDPERLRQSSAYAYSGRLQIASDGAITYEAAQDERIEYRAAAAAVLADYNRLSRRAARRAALPEAPSATASAPAYRIQPPAD